MNKIYLFLVFSILTTIGMAQEKIKQTAGRDSWEHSLPNSQNSMTTFFSAKSGVVRTDSACVTVVW